MDYIYNISLEIRKKKDNRKDDITGFLDSY